MEPHPALVEGGLTQGSMTEVLSLAKMLLKIHTE